MKKFALTDLQLAQAAPSGELVATRAIMRLVREKHMQSNPHILIANVFEAMWSSALTCESIERMASAMYYGGNPVPSLQEALTDMTRRGYLRSRMANCVGGRFRMYEVAY